AGDVAVEGFVRSRHRLGGWKGAPPGRTILRPEVVDERADHADGSRPGAVRRADRLHDILEDGRAAQHAAGTGRHPVERWVGRGELVERREILVEAKDVGDDVEDGIAVAAERLAYGLDRGVSAAAGGDANGPCATAEGKRGLERAGVLVEPVRCEVGEAVRGERARQVDGLAAGADEAELRARWHVG